MYLIVASTAWFLAQFIKVIVVLVTKQEKELNWKNILFGSGGMPSSHSSTITALATYISLKEGINSPVASLAIIMAFIVMHDAMNVRQETGRQGKYLNEIIELFERLGESIPIEKKFKEFVGHTPMQVIFGFLLGLIVALAFFYAM